MYKYFILFVYYMNMIFFPLTLWFIFSRFYYSDSFDSSDVEMMKGLYTVIERMTPDTTASDIIDHQLDKFDRAVGLFGLDMAINARNKKQPGN